MSKTKKEELQIKVDPCAYQVFSSALTKDICGRLKENGP